MFDLNSSPLPWLRALLTIGVVSVATSASADVVPDGKVYVPIDLIFHNQPLFPDTAFVLVGCNSEDGKHAVGFAKPNEPIRCKTKEPPTLHAVPTKDIKALESLVAKDVGWAVERASAIRLVATAPKCGAVEESTLVDKATETTLLTAHYVLERGSTGGCSMKKVGATVAQNPVTTHPTAAATASAAPTAAPVGSSSTEAASPSAAVSKGGCGGCAGCETARSSRTNTFLACAGLAVAVMAAAARRRRR